MNPVSVVIPAYNEESSIGQTISEIVGTMDGSGIEYEIIVVDDGSTDNTYQVIKEIAGRNGKMKIVRHPENLGYGKAIVDGIKVSTYDIIGITDADGTYPVKKFPELLSYMDRYDMVVGARQGREYWESSVKSFARMFFHWLCEFTVGRKIADVNSGFRVFRKDIAVKFAEDLSPAFSFTTTLTLFMFLNHYFVKYLPIDYYKRMGKSKVALFRDTLRTAQLVIQAILYYNPIKLFLLFFFFCLIVSGVFFGLFVVFKDSMWALASVGAFLSSLILFGMGFLADILRKIRDRI
ncbi:MAG: glycosyltransferase family 2 protein [Candidatus Tectomicrobia bacterium]|nr:glycosyltransferase family 2 protein [Candidatus Tectomicrobia bacterium]